MYEKLSKMNSKMDPGSLLGTLVVSRVSTISNLSKFVIFGKAPKVLKLIPGGSPKMFKMYKKFVLEAWSRTRTESMTK